MRTKSMYAPHRSPQQKHSPRPRSCVTRLSRDQWLNALLYRKGYAASEYPSKRVSPQEHSPGLYDERPTTTMPQNDICQKQQGPK